MRRSLSVPVAVAVVAAFLAVTPGTAGASRLIGSFDTGVGSLVGVAVDGQRDSVLVYGAFAETILEYSQTGSLLGEILRPGPASNDFDLDVAETGFTLGSGTVPAGGVLVTNAEASPQKLFGIDAIGNITGELDHSAFFVGGSHHAARGSVFLVDYTTDKIREVDPATGALLTEFPVTPTGSPAFDVYFGDVAVSTLTGNLFVVSSSQTLVRELTPTGDYVRDYDLSSLGINGMSGVDIDPATDEAWIVTNVDGRVYRVALEPTTEGTEGNDTITGTAENDTINAGAGDDVIEGGGGDDTISGGDGNDSIAGDTSSRFTVGSQSEARAFAEGGNDEIDGGAGNDLIDAGLGADAVVGGIGSDRIWGVGGSDDLSGGGGGDKLEGGGDADVLLGGGGPDTLTGGPGADRLNGGPGQDLCIVDSRREKRRAQSCEKITLRRGHLRRG